MDLDTLRKKIDEVDEGLTRLFEQRMDLSRRIGEIKRELALPVLDPKRERALLDDRVKRLSDPSLSKPLIQFFSFLMEAGKELQYQSLEKKSEIAPLNFDGLIAYQGIPGAYSEQAARLYFGEKSRLAEVKRFEDVFTAVEEGRACAGVVPIENLLTGGITEIYDLFERHRCTIIGEQTVDIDHCLLALPDARLTDIKKVASHPQGLLQCEDFLNEHPEWERVPRLNTAEAARYASREKDKSLAAIASAYTAESYGLKVLQRDIANCKGNQTRFAILGPENARSGGDKYTLSLVLGHKIGTLRLSLDALYQGGFSLTFIQSRPFPGRSWEYRFYIDCVAVKNDCDMDNTINKLRESGAQARLLGRYASSRGKL